MNLIYFLDYRFAQTPDGAVWTSTSYDATFWAPYLSAFNRLIVVSRTRQCPVANPCWRRVDSESISVFALPDYDGPIQYLAKTHAVRRSIQTVLGKPGAVILRVPSLLSDCAFRELSKRGRSYAVENVGDAGAALAPGVSRVRARALMRWIFVRSQQAQCRNSIASSYVAQILKANYPSDDRAATLVCSDVRIDQSWLRPEPRRFGARGVRLLTVATFTQMYKGLDVLLEALAECRSKGATLMLTLVGEGRLRKSLEEQCERLDLTGAVSFRGEIPWGPELIAEFDRADLFVLPSRVEALPRALIEAMARALPCIGTEVGGVPELLPATRTVPAGESSSLANRILELTSQPDLLSADSARNLTVSAKFADTLLRPRWEEFYRNIRELTYASTAGQISDPRNQSA